MISNFGSPSSASKYGSDTTHTLFFAIILYKFDCLRTDLFILLRFESSGKITYSFTNPSCRFFLLISVFDTFFKVSTLSNDSENSEEGSSEEFNDLGTDDKAYDEFDVS